MATPEEAKAAFDAAQERQRQAAEERQAERDAQAAEQARLVAARKNGRQFDPKEQPTFTSLNLQKRAEEAEERQAAEAARLASINPRQVWFSTLSFQEQQRVQKWELANPGLLFPMPVGFKVEARS